VTRTISLSHFIICGSLDIICGMNEKIIVQGLY